MKEAIEKNIAELHKYLAADRRLQLVFACTVMVLTFKTVQAFTDFRELQIFFTAMGLLLMIFILHSD